MKKPIHAHLFNFNPQDNSGESLVLKTEFFGNGDKEEKIFTNQRINLHSYCNMATFYLSGCYLSPAMLRKLADELEEAEKIASEKLKVNEVVHGVS